MGKMKDLSGQKFGRLTAISPLSERSSGAVVWECECECGQRKKVRSCHLKSGGVKSCGCYIAISNKKRALDLRGQKFGRLTAISPIEGTADTIFQWECECICGKRKKVPTTSLTSGSVKSCGCYQKERIKDLSGQKFGRLTAIAVLPERVNAAVVWECECSCGEKVKVASRELLSGNNKSCGCLQLETNDRIRRNAYERFGVEGTNLNSLTMDISKRNTSGVKGVSWVKKNKKWRAQITFQRKRIVLGNFKSKEDAVRARKEAEEKYFKPMLEKYQDRLKPHQLGELNSEK